MFTGIIQATGRIISILEIECGKRFEISLPEQLYPLSIGDSLAINGCCLTITKLTPTFCWMDLVPETLERTTFDAFKVGDHVNVETAMTLHKKLDGHLVQGHIDGVGIMSSRRSCSDGSLQLSFVPPSRLLRYIIEKGSIAIDGVSLTIASLNQESFTCAIIPHTAQVTTLGNKKVGDKVNLEVDLIAKYVEKMLEGRSR